MMSAEAGMRSGGERSVKSSRGKGGGGWRMEKPITSSFTPPDQAWVLPEWAVVVDLRCNLATRPCNRTNSYHLPTNNIILCSL
jgi:hypothetical protein